MLEMRSVAYRPGALRSHELPSGTCGLSEPSRGRLRRLRSGLLVGRARIGGLNALTRTSRAGGDDEVALEPWLGRTFRIDEAELFCTRLVGRPHALAPAAPLQSSEQLFVGKRRLDLGLDPSRHRARAHRFVIAILDQPFA